MIGENTETVIIDSGTESFKIGYGGEELPRFVVDNRIGISKNPYIEILSN